MEFAQHMESEAQFNRTGERRVDGSGREAMMASPLAMGAAVIALAVMPGSLRAETKAESLDRLVRAYPEALSGHDEKHIVWRYGTAMPVDDGVDNKSFDDLLRKASIIDQLRLPYALGTSSPPELNDDPGRFRTMAYFKTMYGDCNSSHAGEWSRGSPQGHFRRDRWPCSGLKCCRISHCWRSFMSSRRRHWQDEHAWICGSDRSKFEIFRLLVMGRQEQNRPVQK